MAQNFKKVTHCIFDMDGLLLDTEALYTKATQQILDNYGKTYTWEVKMILMGMKHMEMCKRIVEIYDLPLTPEEYSKLQKEVNSKIMKNAQLLPDTEPVYEEVIRQIAQSYNKTYPIEIRLKILGTTEPRTAEIAVTDIGLPISPQEFLEKFHELCRTLLTNCPLKPGAERLLRHLHTHNVPFCLATSSGEEMVEIKITNHRDVFQLFHHRVCGSSDPDVKQGKPAPDIFLIAASRFPDKPDPSKCLVFEDAPNGVKAAHSAGMQVVMVPDERVPLEMSTLATQRLKSLEEFQPELYGLPPFEN
ncbi:pseudouridine 5'-phosphatase-like Gs1l isoform 2-T2 [Cochliomyia hominivorax]